MTLAPSHDPAAAAAGVPVQPVFTFVRQSGKLRRCLSSTEFETVSRTGVVAVSGFVANRAELVARLAGAHNPALNLATDAGLITALWRIEGARTAELMCGNAAWIAYDAEKRELTAVNDRMGTQGFYYAQYGTEIWLSLSLDALLACWPGRRRVNPSAVVRQLNMQEPVEGETHYLGIRALPRGCVFTLGGGQTGARHYWRLNPMPELKLSSDAAYADAYRTLLFQVAREYAPAERAAITLSSGMDSTSVAAALREAAPSLDLVAMTWTTPELPVADEVSYVREVAAKLDLPLHEVRGDQHWTLCHPEGVRTSVSTPFTLYYDDLWDAGYAAIRDAGATTVFGGTPGDVLFGGSVFAYADLLLEGRWLRCAREFRAHMQQSTSGITWPQAIRRMVLGPLVRSYLPGLVRSRLPQPVKWLQPAHIELWQSTQTPKMASPVKPGRRMRFDYIANPFNAQVGVYAHARAQRIGLQLRQVLFDHRLVEFALSLPADQTSRNGQRKTIMRNAMRGRLPDSVVNMWGKIVPTTISERGLRERETAKVWGYLTNMRAAEMGFVDEQALRRGYQDYLTQKTNDASFFYAVTLEDWLRRYF